MDLSNYVLHDLRSLSTTQKATLKRGSESSLDAWRKDLN